MNDDLVSEILVPFNIVLVLTWDYFLQGQMLTLVEYLLLLYRALLPAPVWYRFFLNKEYGSLFSSLMTGLYLTFKLTSVVEKVYFNVHSLVFLLSLLLKFHCVASILSTTYFGILQVQCFITALRALSRKEIHYGAYATSEQVSSRICLELPFALTVCFEPTSNHRYSFQSIAYICNTWPNVCYSYQVINYW